MTTPEPLCPRCSNGLPICMDYKPDGTRYTHEETCATYNWGEVVCDRCRHEMRWDATTALVILFQPGGKYYTEEWWRIPEGAIGPYDMQRSSDFRRIGGGPVLVDTQEPWGYPHLFLGEGYRA